LINEIVAFQKLYCSITQIQIGVSFQLSKIRVCAMENIQDQRATDKVALNEVIVKFCKLINPITIRPEDEYDIISLCRSKKIGVIAEFQQNATRINNIFITSKYNMEDFIEFNRILTRYTDLYHSYYPFTYAEYMVSLSKESLTKDVISQLIVHYDTENLRVTFSFLDSNINLSAKSDNVITITRESLKELLGVKAGQIALST